MVTRNIQFAEEEFYHVYNRGNDKRDIFKTHSDYVRFQELLFLSNATASVNVRDIKTQHDSIFDFDRGSQQVAIGAYCLMPNHFHILLTPVQENGVSAFMNKLTTSYSMYFNKRYDRTGSLFEGRFKARYADDDEYLKYLFSYIHLNPVKLIQSDWKEVGIKAVGHAYEYVANYKYSSFMDYLDTKREASDVLNPDRFPEYFSSSGAIQEEIFQWLTYSEPESP